jgi:hypothetical protein
MALQEKRVTVPISVGVDEETSAEVLEPPMLRSCLNGRFDKTGRVSKRLGYSTLALTIHGGGGSSIGAGKRLLQRGPELDIIDGHFIYGFEFLNNGWIKRSRVPEAMLERRAYAGEWASGNLDQADVAVSNNGYKCLVFRDRAVDDIYARIIGTGDELVIESRLTTQGACPRVVAVGNTFLITWVDGTNIRGCFFITSPLDTGFSGVTNLVTNHLSGSELYDTRASSSNLYVINVRNGGANEIDVRRLSTVFAVTHTAPDIRPGKVGGRVAIFGDSGGNAIYCAFSNVTDSTVEVIGLLPADLSSVFTVQTIATGVTSAQGLTVGPRAANAVWVLYDIERSVATPPTNQGAIAWRGVSSAGAVDATAHTTCNLQVASKIFATDGYSYVCAVVANDQSDQRGLVIVDLGNAYVASADYRARPVARWANGELYNNLDTHLPNVRAISSTSFVTIHVMKDPTSPGVSRGATVEIATIHLGDSGQVARWDAQVQTEGETIFAGALPHVYDGARAFEAVNTYYPWIEYSRVVAGGSLTVDTTYQYRVVYVYVDRQGRVWRSTPSLTATLTTAGANLTAEIYVPHYSVTNMVDVDGGFMHPVGVELYRRNVSVGGADAAFVRLVGVVVAGSITASDPLLTNFLLLTDNGGLSETGQPQLYTTDGVQPAWPVEPLLDICMFDNRLFGHDGKRIYLTREIVKGEGPAWQNAVIVGIAGERTISKLAVMGSYLVILCTDGIFWMQGIGPDDRGFGAQYTEPQRLESDVGCSEPRSVVVGPFGMVFQSPLGLHLLDPQMRLRWFGAPVTDTLDLFPVVTSAALLASEQQLRVTVKNSDSGLGRVLVWDYHHDQWITHKLYGANAYAPEDAVIYNGLYLWLHSTGTTALEVPGVFVDTTGVSNEFIGLEIETANVKLDGLSGFVRVWHVTLTGKALYASAADSPGYTVEIFNDYSASVENTFTRTSTQVQDADAWPLVQFRMGMARQECQAKRIRIRETVQDSVNYNQGIAWMSAMFEYGVEPRGVARFGANQRA